MTPEQLIAHATTLARRLSRALDAVDAGDTSAAGDLAAHLRTLLGTAHGNRVLQRLNELPGARIPWVTTGRAPLEIAVPARDGDIAPEDRRGTIISVGYLPLEGPKDGPPSEHTMRFFDWIARTSIVYPETLQRHASWVRFATDAGNTFGSHIGKHTPDYLHQASVFGVADLSLTDYLLRQIAWQVERSLERLLLSLGQELELHDRPLELFGCAIQFLHHFRDGTPNTRQWSVEFRFASVPAELLRFEWDGTHRIVVDASRRIRIETPPGFLDKKPSRAPG